MPLELPATVTTVAKRRLDQRDRPYGFAEALAFCLRGQGPLLLAGYVVFMVAAGAIRAIGGCLAQLALLLAVAFLTPGMLFEIVRQSAAGETEPPDWPDFFDYGERFREIWRFALVVAVSLVPTIVLLRLSGCDGMEFLRGERGPGCWSALVLGTALGVPIGVFAFGAAGLHRTAWLAFRLDLHLRALASLPVEGLRTSGLLAALLVVSQLADWLLRGIPLLGGTIEHAISAYTLFTGAHLVGILFRHHAENLERIYITD
ncbi:MAG: hypothetical protein U0X73_04575 [Thermoanaerobaculia bacterium]